MKNRKLPLCLLSILTVINVSGQTQRQIENISTFSKLYGYVKYFHPSDEAASVDWYRFAIYGSRKVENCKSSLELRDSLKSLFLPIAPTLQVLTQPENWSYISKEMLMLNNHGGYKTIAWQHKGVGLGNQGNIYQSARTYRPVKVVKSPTDKFAPLSSTMDATPWKNREFIFRCRIKMIKDEGTGHLWVRVNRTDSSIGFFENMNDRPIYKGDWKTYEIKGVMDAHAARINFGVFLSGDGELWMDDMSLLVKEGNEWKEVYTNSFSSDHPGKMPKGLSVNNNTLASYAVSVENKEAHNAYYVSIKSKDNKINIEGNGTPLFDKHPIVGEYVNKNIGSDLKAIVLLALYGNDEKTFPAADKEQLQLLKEALQQVPIATLKGNDLHTRLGDLIMTWNIFQHFYPYFDIAKTDWNADLKEAIRNAYADKTEEDFQRTLQKLTAKLKDGHVGVYLFTSKSAFFPPISWEWIENELVITQVGDSSLPLVRGDIIKKINGREARAYFQDIYQRISAATKGWLEWRAQSESLVGERGDVLNLEVINVDNMTKNVQLNRTMDMKQFYAMQAKKDSIKSLGKGIYYINIDKASIDKIEKALPELVKSQVIICDLRGYPNSNHKLIQYLLTEKDTSTQWMQVPQIIYPDGIVSGYEKHGWNLNPIKPHLNAKIIFIIDGRAISYAESFMSFIEHYKLATIVGQPTAGTNGNVNPFALPGGYYISWTGMKVLKHDGSQHHGIGILPDIYVQKTIRGIRENRDEFLEKALEIANKPI